jgi:predicted membrane channel-forming protein YqfA (hemolysin III family)
MAQEGNPFVAIAAVVAGITMVMLLFVLIFDPGQVWVLMPVSGAMAFMGIFLGYFMSKPRRFRK